MTIATLPASKFIRFSFVTGNDLPPLSKLSERPHFRKFVTDFKRLVLIPASLANATGGAYSHHSATPGTFFRQRLAIRQKSQTHQAPQAFP